MDLTDARAPFLLMAHHRSGSNFLHDLLQSHPRIECVNEPFSMHTRFFRQCDLVRWSDVDYDPAALHVALAKHDGLRAYLRELKQYLMESNRARVVGFKETALFGKLEWLKAFLPSLKVLYLTRDPRAVVSSVLRSGLFEFWRYRDLVPRAFQEICPRYQSRCAETDPSIRDAEVAAMSVATRHELARRTLHLFDHRLVPLEEMAQDPATCLQSIADFLGIEPHPDQAAFLRRRQVASRGGIFSSFRDPQAVQLAWRGHLNARQVEVIEDVLFAAQRETLGDALTPKGKDNAA